MKNLFHGMVGLAATLLTVILGWVTHVDLNSLTSNPLWAIVLVAAVGFVSKGIGALLAKTGPPPPQTLEEAKKVMAQQSAAQSRGR